MMVATGLFYDIRHWRFDGGGVILPIVTMTSWRLAACVFVLAAATAAEASAADMDKGAVPVGPLRAVLDFTPPAGWKESDYANSAGADPVLQFEKGLDRIALYLYGAPGSAYKDPATFLRGPAATTMGRPAQPDGHAVVGGKRLVVLRRGVPLMLGDPHAASSGEPRLGSERFVVLPLTQGRFVVAVHDFSSPVPSLDRSGEKAFTALLRTLKPKPSKPKK